MLRLIFALLLACAALHLADAARAAAPDLAPCLDPATVIGAGGEVSDKDLAAAQSACARLQQSTQDEKLLIRLQAAASTLASEAKRRGKN
jgi:hypothetical protein